MIEIKSDKDAHFYGSGLVLRFSKPSTSRPVQRPTTTKFPAVAPCATKTVTTTTTTDLDVNDCDVNATCTNTKGSFSYACNDGFSDDDVTYVNVDECA